MRSNLSVSTNSNVTGLLTFWGIIRLISAVATFPLVGYDMYGGSEPVLPSRQLGQWGV